MGTIILNIDYLNRIGKFMSLSMAEGLAKEKVINFHRLNCLNYAKVMDEEYRSNRYSIEDLNFSEIPLISSVQAVSDLEAVHVNCLDYGLELDLQTYEEMRIRIEQFKENYDYDEMKQYKDYVLY